MEFPQPLRLAHNLALSTITNQIFTSVIKLGFPLSPIPSQLLWLARYFLLFLLKPSVCNKNVTSST